MDDLCLCHVISKYFSKLRFGHNKIQPELECLENILFSFYGFFLRQGFENTSCLVFVHHSFPLYSNCTMKFTINTKHSTFELKGNVTLVAPWVFCWPSHTTVPCSFHTAARGNSERFISCISRAVWKLNQFSKRVIFNNNYYMQYFWHQPGSNQGPPAILTASLPSALSMSSIRRLKFGPFVCKYIIYVQSLIYFKTELLTRAKFSRHVWTGFCCPTGDGKWSHHKSLSI